MKWVKNLYSFFLKFFNHYYSNQLTSASVPYLTEIVSTNAIEPVKSAELPVVGEVDDTWISVPWTFFSNRIDSTGTPTYSLNAVDVEKKRFQIGDAVYQLDKRAMMFATSGRLPDDKKIGPYLCKMISHNSIEGTRLKQILELIFDDIVLLEMSVFMHIESSEPEFLFHNYPLIRKRRDEENEKKRLNDLRIRQIIQSTLAK